MEPNLNPRPRPALSDFPVHQKETTRDREEVGCKKIAEALAACKSLEASVIDPATTRLLEEQGYFLTRTKESFELSKPEERELQSLSTKIDSKTQLALEYQTERKELKKTIDGFWKSTAAFFSGKLGKTKEQIGYFKRKEELLADELQPLRDRHTDLDTKQATLTKEKEQFSATSDPKVYAQLTNKGALLLRCLEAYGESLDTQSFQEFREGLNQIGAQLHSEISAAKILSERLENHGYHPSVASELACMQLGHPKDLYEQITSLASPLDSLGLNRSEMLQALRGLALKDGSPNQLAASFATALNAIEESGYKRNPATIQAATTLAQGGDSKCALSKVESAATASEKIQESLGEGNKIPEEIAFQIGAVLSQAPDSDKALSKFLESMDAYEAAGVRKGLNLIACATSSALQEGDTLTHIDQTIENANAMTDRWGYSAQHLLPASLMTGGTSPIEAKLLLAEDITHRLSAANISKPYQRAVQLLAISNGSLLASLAKQVSVNQSLQATLDIYDMADSASRTYSSYDYSSSNSGSGFDIGWAVAGDIIDNGSMDFSGGFIAGGLLGGLF